MSHLSKSLIGGVVVSLAACSVSVQDDARLQSLSEAELTELCDELGDQLGNQEQIVECEEGRSIALLSPPENMCVGIDFSACGATAGDMRACYAAARSNPCVDYLPQACAPLFQGCAPWVTANPMFQFCAEPAPSELTPFEGIYEIVTHTSNQNSCASEGESALAFDREQMLVVRYVSSYEILQPRLDVQGWRVEIASCRDAEHCRAVLRETVEPVRVVPELERRLSCGAGAEATISGRTRDFSPGDDVCELVFTDTLATRSAQGLLRLEEYTTSWRMPSDPNGCFISVDGPPPSPAPCAALDVYEARFVSPL